MAKTTRLMLFLSVILILGAGCSGHPGMAHHGSGGGDATAERGLSQMRMLIDSTVKDPEKAKHAHDLVAAIVGEVRTLTQQNRTLHERLYELNARYDATPEDFLKILDQLNNNRMKAGTTILGLRFKMKELVTAEEWAALSRGLNDARSRYRHGAPAEAEGKAGS